MSELNSAVRHGSSIWQQNPVVIHLLGLSPLLALSSSLILAAMLLLCLVLILIAGTVSDQLLARRFPGYDDALWRLPALALLLTVPGSFMDWLLTRYLPEVHESLGLYVLLLCCNFTVLVHLQTQRGVSRMGQRLRCAITVAGGYAVALLALTTIREFRTYGRLFHDGAALFTDTTAAAAQVGQLGQLFSFAASQPAALLLLGLVIAAAQQINLIVAAKKANPHSEITPASRARVTEKLQ